MVDPSPWAWRAVTGAAKALLPGSGRPSHSTPTTHDGRVVSSFARPVDNTSMPLPDRGCEQTCLDAESFAESATPATLGS